MRYIIVPEDDESYQSDIVKDEEKEACDNGIWDVFDTKTMKQFYDGEWHDISPRDD